MGGRGSPSRLLPNPSNAVDVSDWEEAFSPGVDFQKTGDVDHRSRTVTQKLQRQWDQFTAPYQSGVSSTDQAALMKDWDYRTNQLYGYIRTTNSFKINQQLYDPKNAGKTDAQIFTRRDRNGRLRDLQTVQTLDRAIANHSTQKNAIYTRFCSPNALRATFNLTPAQMSALQSAGSMTPAQLKTLNAAFAGKSSYSKAYTSTSANRSINAFGNPKAPQSKGFIFERKIYAPQGTKAYAAQKNAQESEVIFGRGLQTSIMKVTIASDGHIVIHEMYDRYR